MTLSDKNFSPYHLETLEDNVQLLTLPNSLTPLIFFQILLPAGLFLEAKTGMTHIISSLLATGPQSLTESAFSQKISTLGLFFTVTPEQHALCISLTVHKMRFRQALNLIEQCLFNPRFDPMVFNRELQFLSDRIQNSKFSPIKIARNEANSHLFGQHPYGKKYDSYQKELVSNTLEQVKQTYESLLFHSDQAVFGVSGDINEKIILLIKQFISRFQWNNSPLKKAPSKPKFPKKNIFVSQQTVKKESIVKISFPGISVFESQKEVPLNILFSYFSASNGPFYNVIREKYGLAYWIDAYYGAGRLHPSLLSFEAGTEAQSALRVKELFHQQINLFLKKGFSKHSFICAKKAILYSETLDFSYPQYQLFKLLHKIYYHLSPEEVVRSIQSINQVQIDEVMEIAHAYLSQPSVEVIVTPQN